MFRSFNKAKQRNIIYAIVLNVVLCVFVLARIKCCGRETDRERETQYLLCVCVCGLKFKRRHSINGE